MARASILTIEPIGLGGVPTMTSAMYRLLAVAGHQPHLVYIDQESVPTAGRRVLLAYFRAHWRPRWEQRRGMRGLAVPRYPAPLRAHWYLPALTAPRALRSEMRIVVSGSAHTGLPYTLGQHRFVIWVATRYGDEIQGREQAGDPWARQLLASPMWPRLQAQESHVLRRAARIIALSPNTARRIVADYPELQQRTDTVLCPIDTDLFHPPAGKVANPVGAPYLLLTARIADPRKNVSMLLDAFARIRAARPELKLVIIGDRPSPAQQRQTQRLQLDGSVLYLPPKPPSELIPFYQAAELFVLSSTQEGLAISMLESLACGLPVVATRCGGPEGVIRNDETGLLVPNDNAAAFAEGVLSLLHDPVRATAMRKRAAGFAQANVAQPLIANQLRKSLGHVYPQHFDA